MIGLIVISIVLVVPARPSKPRLLKIFSMTSLLRATLLRRLSINNTARSVNASWLIDLSVVSAPCATMAMLKVISVMVAVSLSTQQNLSILNAPPAQPPLKLDNPNTFSSTCLRFNLTLKNG
jgi:hypothetical protein